MEAQSKTKETILRKLEQFNHLKMYNHLHSEEDPSISSKLLKDLENFDFEFFKSKFELKDKKFTFKEERYSGDLLNNLLRAKGTLYNPDKTTSIDLSQLTLDGLKSIYEGIF